MSVFVQSCTPRWQTCIGNTDDTLGFALGALFVKATFDKQSKEIVSYSKPFVIVRLKPTVYAMQVYVLMFNKESHW